MPISPAVIRPRGLQEGKGATATVILYIRATDDEMSSLLILLERAYVTGEFAFGYLKIAIRASGVLAVLADPSVEGKCVEWWSLNGKLKI